MASGTTATLALAAVVACATVANSSCKPTPTVEDRPLFVHAPRSCPVSQSKAYAVIEGSGDFDSAPGAVASLFLRDVGREVDDLPEKTRAIVVEVSQDEPRISWKGIADVPPRGAVNVLVWPVGETCRLSRNVEPRSDATLGVFGRHIMVAGGRTEGQVPRTFVGDLSTGILERLEFGLGLRRSLATVTAFRETADQDPAPALVAGGEDPDSRVPLATAEVYLPGRNRGDLGDFERVRIDLADARSNHGAVVLASGETLLIGGQGQGGVLLRTLEAIDPKTRRSRTSGLSLLAVPRKAPTVLRLASGEVLVAGGLNERGQNVPTLEWFSPDASRASRRPVDLVTGRERGFVPLAAGGALAVVAPSLEATDFKTVWVISADGAVEAATPLDPASLDIVRLFPGPEGAPVLWTGKQWLRWQPWFGTFQPLADAPSRGPSKEAPTSSESGLALWLDNTADENGNLVLAGQVYVRGYRFAAKSRFESIQTPLLAFGPAGLSPDRVAGTPGSSLRFVDGLGLELGPGASAFVDDLTYGDVSVELEGKRNPSIVFRQDNGAEIEVGGPSCPAARVADASLSVQRRGARVEYIVAGEPRTCPTELDAEARITIGIRGGNSGPSAATALRITRR